MVTFQELNEMHTQVLSFDVNKEIEKIKKEISTNKQMAAGIFRECGHNHEVKALELKTNALVARVKCLEECGKKEATEWELTKIIDSIVEFPVDLIMSSFAELFSSLQNRPYKYYEVLSTDRETCEGERDTLYRRLYRVFSTIPYAIYYPENHMEKRTNLDMSLIMFTGSGYYTTLGMEEFGKHIYFDRSKFPTVSLYKCNRGCSFSFTAITPFIGGKNNFTYYDEVQNIVNYSKMFINKVIDYRLEKVYPSFSLDKPPTYDSFVASKEREDITSDELNQLLTDFIADYKAGVKVKQKVDSE